MAADLDNSTFNALVAQIPGAQTERARKNAAGAAVAYLSTTNTLDVWANSICNEAGYTDRVGREDIPGVIAVKMMRSLTAVNAEQVAGVRNWASYMHGQAENAVKDYLASGAVTVASGMSGAHRRGNTIAIARRDLTASLGRVPTPQEIIDSANEYLLTTRKDPARQGALLTLEDFSNTGLAAMSVDEFSETGFDIVAEATIEEQVEASMAAQKLVELCKKEYPGDVVLPDVARTWIRLHLEGERVSVIRISKELDITRAVAKAATDRLDELLELMRDAA